MLTEKETLVCAKCKKPSCEGCLDLPSREEMQQTAQALAEMLVALAEGGRL
jgi:hypothetical protein